MARWAARGATPRTRTAATVPRSGRARSVLGGSDHERISREQAAHAVGDMAARKSCPGDIFYIVVQLQRRAVVLADNLRPPPRQRHLAAVAFVIVENFELPHGAARIECHGIVDELVFANH